MSDPSIHHPTGTQQGSSRGFTLVEIMVVVVILSVFAGVVSLSIGSSEVRKNRGFYEHFVSTMGYIRLLSAEQMTPMGIRLVTDESGQVVAEVVRLDNAYLSYQTIAKINSQDRQKNAMELSVDIRNNDKSDDKKNNQAQRQPTWASVDDVDFLTPPADVEVNIIPLDQNLSGQQALQPWFVGQDVPSLLWFGTGQASTAKVEITYHDRLVGDAIYLSADGSVKVGSAQ